jgi:hypothetical protein
MFLPVPPRPDRGESEKVAPPPPAGEPATVDCAPPPDPAAGAQALREPQPPSDRIYHFAIEQMRAGVAPAEVEQSLVRCGLSTEAAAAVVGDLKRARSEALREAGRKNMRYGAMWCVGGVVVTVLTLQAAAGGGQFVIAWGAILFGAIQFFRGLGQSASG